MLSTKSTVSAIGEILGKKSREFTFVDPPLIAAPSTQIIGLNGLPRMLPDPAYSAKIAIGAERIRLDSVRIVQGELGPNGETIWEPSNRDKRIRFVGEGWTNTNNEYGLPINSAAAGDFFEVTFWGTDLNLIIHNNNSAYDIRATVDGGAESANLYTAGTSYSNILGGRYFKALTSFPVASGLTQGLHTVKVRLAAAGIMLFGVDIINSGGSLKIGQGDVFANGKKHTIGSSFTSPYNSGFDGSPILNGKGGCVINYMSADGQFKKIIQQTDDNVNFSVNADHSSEELIERVNWRDMGIVFGTDDFSTIGVSSNNRAFTRDDMSTILYGSNVGKASQVTVADALQITTGAGFYDITFTGTGIDLISYGDVTTAADSHTFAIDGATIATLAPATVQNKKYVTKLASGLPYGSHKLRVTRVAAVSSSPFNAFEFLIYAPKRPTLPDGAAELSQYYLVADFVANATAGVQTIATGVIRHSGQRGPSYVNGTGGSADWSSAISVTSTCAGFNQQGDRLNQEYRKAFQGTGFDYRFSSDSNRSQSVLVLLNGVTLNTTNFPTIVSSVYGGGAIAFNSGTGVLNMRNAGGQNGCGFRISGLPYGNYNLTLRNQNSGATERLDHDCIDIIMPVHFPDRKRGNLSVGPSVQLKQEANISGVDLSKAKAWIIADWANNKILDSYNVSSIVDKGTGIFQIFFIKPFRDRFYMWAGSSDLNAIPESSDGGTQIFPGSFDVLWRNDAATLVEPARGGIVFFGELQDEDGEP